MQVDVLEASPASHLRVDANEGAVGGHTNIVAVFVGIMLTWRNGLYRLRHGVDRVPRAQAQSMPWCPSA